MKIIDILNKKANGTLEDGFKFILDNEVYRYNKRDDRLMDKDMTSLGVNKYVDNILNDEVEVVLRDEENKEIEKTEIERIRISTYIDTKNKDLKALECLIHFCEDKINELVQAVNKINGVLKK